MARLPAACLRLQRRVADAVTATGTLHRGERALLMLSGGADSMALLSLVRAADRRLALGLSLAALHVDYGLRGADSDRDRLIVERACREARPQLYVVRLRGGLSGPDFQARAREHRYARARELAAGTATRSSSRRTTATTRRRRSCTGLRSTRRRGRWPGCAPGTATWRGRCSASERPRSGSTAARPASSTARTRPTRAAVRAQRPAPRGAAAARDLNPRLAETLAASAASRRGGRGGRAHAVAAEARARVDRPPAIQATLRPSVSPL